MMMNALNSGARVFMADFEDATSPTWQNLLDGQINVADAVRRAISFTTSEGREYRLHEQIATLVIRPRGWHLDEVHLQVDGTAMSGSLVDAGLYLFHNAHELLARGLGPYFYLPKLECAEEARLWNDVFLVAQTHRGLARGTVRATVLIETILGAFEMEEMLYELREHAAGLNRAQVTMSVPFMRAYAERLVDVCHRRGAHAIGGMAAFIPSRRDAEVNARALARVSEDKQREASQGFDGTWVAHPDLVPVAQRAFDAVLGDRANQKSVVAVPGALREPAALIELTIPDSSITAAGVRLNVDVALQYMEAWLGGQGAVAIHNLMEDAATAEISRAQLWQWVRHAVTLDDGTLVTPAYYREVRDGVVREVAAARGLEPDAVLRASAPDATGSDLSSGDAMDRLVAAARLLDTLVLTHEFVEFLTIPGYRELHTRSRDV
jgi:malate synthase